MSFRGWLLGPAGAAVVCCLVSTAEAELSEADAKRLAELLRNGAEAASAKHWQACVEDLSAAAALDDAATTFGDLGLCEEQAGKFTLAHTHLRRAMEGAPPQVVKEPWIRYQTALARTKERVGLLLVTTFPPNAKVMIDGRPVGIADGRAFAVEPGTHTIAARLEGYEDATESRTVRARDQPSLYFHLTEKPKTVAPAVANAQATALLHPATLLDSKPLGPLFLPDSSPRGFLVGLTYAGALLTVASTSVWIAFELDRASWRSHLDRSACNPAEPSPPAACATIAQLVEKRNTAIALTITAGIGTATLMIASAIAISQEWRTPRTAIVPVVHEHGGGIAVGGVW